MAPTLDYLTGFNHQIGTFPTSESDLGFKHGTLTIDTATVRRTGGASAKAVASAATSDFSKQLNGGSAVSFVAAVCYINFSSLPTGAANIFTTNTGSGDGLAYNNSGSRFVTLGNNSFGTTLSSLTVVTGVWYRVEIGLDFSTTTYNITCSVATADGAGTTFSSTSATRTANPTAVVLSAGIGGGASGTVYVTDFAASVQSADFPIGPLSVYGYSPNAVGTHNLDASTSTFFFSDTSAPPGSAGTALTTSETTSYQNIDDLPLDTGTDAVKVITTAGAPNTPTFRSAGTWSFTANNVASPFTATPGAPAGKAVGDLLLLVCESRSITATVATPTGWTVLTNFPKRSGTASGGSIYIFSRIADGTGNDTPSPIWTGQTTGTSGDASGAGILAYTNATVTQDATATSQDLSAQGSTSSITGITTTTDKSLVVNVAMKLNEAASNTSTVTTYTEDADNSTTSGTGHTVTVNHLVKTPAGASGSGTITWIATTSARALIATVALKASTPLVQPTNTWYAEHGFQTGATVGASSDPYAVRAIVAQELDTAVASTWAAGLYDSTATPTVVGPFGATGGGVATLDGTIPTGTNTLDAQSYTFSSNDYIAYIEFRMSKAGSPSDNVYCTIEADSSGAPSGTALFTSALVPASSFVTTTVVRFVFPDLTNPGAGIFWFVLHRSGAPDSSNDYGVEFTFTSNASPWSSQYSFGWSHTGLSFWYKIGWASVEPVSNGSISTTTKTYVGKTFDYRPSSNTSLLIDSGIINSANMGSITNTQIGQTFTATATGILSSITVGFAASAGTPTDGVVAQLWSDGGTAPSALLATSNTVAAAALGVGTVFTFGYRITNGTVYWIVLSRTGSLDAVNFYKVGLNNTGYAGGQQWTFTGSWSAQANDFSITVNQQQLWTLAALNSTRLRFGYTAAASGDPRLAAAMLEAAHPIRSMVLDPRRVVRNMLLRL